ncbi:MAG: hypothetical protein JWR55_2454 [Aeromicrobium sp.]|jgi:hypothetical protein|nr:hypothetical protein [Aeromicrobium sp.]
MSTSRPDVRQTVVDFLTCAGKLPGAPVGDVSLAADGVGLDSLEIAELSVTLQDAHGSDPFSSGRMPRTLDEVVDFYES